MEFLKIWLLSIVAAITYGILHDQVTAHICVEYFSVAHPMILPLSSPTPLALEWGVLATWWVGAFLGILLSLAARSGPREKLSAREIIRPLVTLLFCMAIGALVAGTAGFFFARAGLLSLDGWLAAAIPPAKHSRFIADSWAHSASYLIGFVGGIALCVWVYRTRRSVAAAEIGASTSP
jgi:hypothetical protein